MVTLQAKPIYNISPAVSKYLKLPVDKVELIPVPKKIEKGVLEKLGDGAPYFILAYGADSLNKLLEWVPLPPFVSTIIKWSAKGLSYAAKQYSVEQKELGK